MQSVVLVSLLIQICLWILIPFPKIYALARVKILSTPREATLGEGDDGESEDCTTSRSFCSFLFKINIFQPKVFSFSLCTQIFTLSLTTVFSPAEQEAFVYATSSSLTFVSLYPTTALVCEWSR